VFAVTVVRCLMAGCSQTGLAANEHASRKLRLVSCVYPDLPWDPPSHIHNGCRVPFPGVKRPGRGVAWRGVNHSPASSYEVKERVEPLRSVWAFVAYSKVNFTSCV
jgi:hypothetical protein